jgi:hypothetical protein
MRIVSLALTLAVAVPAMAQNSRWDDLANLPFPNGYPTKEAADRQRDELVFQRAVQVYMWALPAVNLIAMKEGSEKAFGAGYNVFPVWKKRLNPKTIVTTPNSDVIYAMAYVDVGRDGPLVIEIPPEQQGILDDFWQRPIAGPTVDGKIYAGDVGLAGPDKGNGGKFLVLPPGYNGDVPDGYFVYRSRTNNVLVFWRAFFNDPADLGPPNKLIEQTRIYPLGKEAQATPMQFPDASGVPVNMDYPTDSAFFDMLARFIESETVDPTDADWRGMLATIGIVKGQPFNPDARTRQILDTAAKTAFKMSRSLIYADLEGKPGALIYPDRHWVDPTLSGSTNIEYLDKSGTFRALDLRTGVFSMIYAASPAMLSATPGEGARYLTAFKDASGNYLLGDATYRLHLPPNVPAAFFWSATLYDPLTASGLDNGQPFPSLNSHDKPEANPDGSFDLYFGPKAPTGKEANWRRTLPGQGFFMILRLYGPTQAYFDKSWKPGDLEKMN